MAIQIVSDLHLESPRAYDVFRITPAAPYLALLGDIGYVHDPGYLSFLESQLAQFRGVFHVVGNHEPYGSNWEAAMSTLREFERQNRERRAAKQAGAGPGEYILLDRAHYDVPELGVTILGCTLFSRVPPAAMADVGYGLNDFHVIENWTVEQHNAAHDRNLEWLNGCVRAISQNSDRKIVVLTHHCPTVDGKALDPKYTGSPIAPGFSTDLRGQDCWESPSVRLWASGHTHFNCDFRDERTGKRIYTNQRGYHFEQ